MSKLFGDAEELTDIDAMIVKGMIERGDKNETIAAYFGVNQRAISHIRSKKKFQIWIFRLKTIRLTICI